MKTSFGFRWGISLDSVVVTFKEQYLGRSEMWRLKNRLINTCAHINKTIEFGDTGVRCQVNELWNCQGERVASGLITSDTKMVFRQDEKKKNIAPPKIWKLPGIFWSIYQLRIGGFEWVFDQIP